MLSNDILNRCFCSQVPQSLPASPGQPAAAAWPAHHAGPLPDDGARPAAPPLPHAHHPLGAARRPLLPVRLQPPGGRDARPGGEGQLLQRLRRPPPPAEAQGPRPDAPEDGAGAGAAAPHPQDQRDATHRPAQEGGAAIAHEGPVADVLVPLREFRVIFFRVRSAGGCTFRFIFYLMSRCLQDMTLGYLFVFCEVEVFVYLDV